VKSEGRTPNAEVNGAGPSRQHLRDRTKTFALRALQLVRAQPRCLWLEIVVESGMLPAARVRPLLCEANELVAIFVALRRTAKRSAR
jgi:hypothetical protein